MSDNYHKLNNFRENINFFINNSEKDYVDTIQNMIKSDPFRGHKFYIFSFVKRVNDLTGVKKMYHQARLTKPDPLPGTTLMKVDPKDPDKATIIWTLPNQENFGLYQYGKMFSDKFVFECIERYQKNPAEMCKADSDDLTDDQIREIYQQKKKPRTFFKDSRPN